MKGLLGSFRKRTGCRAVLSILTVFLFVLNFCFLYPLPGAQAATFVVTNLGDSGAGSLRQAITNAESGTGGMITFSVTGLITLCSPLPTITQDLTIQGPGEAEMTIDGGNSYRVFWVDGGNVTISGLTVKGGKALGNNGSIGENGNGSGGGGGGGGGGCGVGGGLLVMNGSVSIDSVNFNGNNATGGDGGNGGTGGDGTGSDIGGAGGAGGGDLNNTHSGVGGSSFTGVSGSNQGFGGGYFAGGGGGSGGVNSGGGDGGVTLSGGSGGYGGLDGGAGGDGGGYGAMPLPGEPPNAGLGGCGGYGGGGYGGAVFVNNNSTLVITNSMFSGNSANGGSGGDYGGGNTDGGDGGEGCGGAVFVNSGTLVITNSTFSGNSVTGGSGGTGYINGVDGSATAKSLYNRFLRVMAANVTFDSVPNNTIGPIDNPSITATGGTPQSATVGIAYAYNLAATVSYYGIPVSGVNVTFTAPATGASGAFSSGTTYTGITDSNGVATAGPFTANNIAGSYTVTATSAGGASATFGLTNNNTGPVDAGRSTVAASPSSVTADGADSSTIIVTLKDANGNPVSGKTVALEEGSGQSVITAVYSTTNSNGAAVFTVTDTRAETVTYTATDTTDNPNVVVTQTAQVQFTSGSAGYTLLSVSPTSVPADGTTPATVTATVYDANNNPVSGANVTFSTNLGSLGTTSPVTTDANGRAANTITSTTAGTATVQTQVNGCPTVSSYVYFTPTMAVTGLVPAYGQVAGGTLVTVNGSGLSTATAVYFGSSAGQISGTLGSVSLSAYAPSGPSGGGSVHVVVYGHGGPSAETSADLFTYLTHSSSGGSTAQPVNNTGSSTLNPAIGGTVSLGSDVSLTIPKGALQGSSDVNVSIQNVASPPAAPQGDAIVGVYEFTVGGQDHYQFNGPVTLTFSFDPSQIPAGYTPVVFYYDDTTNQLVDIGGTVNWNNNTIMVMVEHFTKYAVMAVPQTQTAPAAPTFSDVPSSYWAYAAISSLSGKGIVSGYTDGTFKPDVSITRAEFATMLTNTLGLNTTGVAGQFTDVTPGDWYYNSVNATVYAGLASGMGSNLFAPNAPITREQMAVMVARALGSKAPAVDGTELNAFSDRSAVSSWAVTGMEEVVKAGIVNGMTAYTLAPHENATRAQAAAMICKMLNILGK